jgi:hypothetical protein
MSPLRHFKILRMARASILLQTTFLSIKEIAAEVGYNDSGYFMRDFKRAYGLTPSQHRARCHALQAFAEGSEDKDQENEAGSFCELDPKARLGIAPGSRTTSRRDERLA